MSPEELRKLVENAARTLSEHAEHVQVMVSWNEETITHRVYSGTGNWYARQGMAHEFIQMDVAQTNAAEIASKLEPPPDESEAWRKQ